MPGFFWVAKTTQGFFGVLYFSSAQINNNISAIPKVVAEDRMKRCYNSHASFFVFVFV